MRDGLPGSDPFEILAYLRKRAPGRKPIEALDRIALILECELDDPIDADLVRGLAGRLRLIRTALRGKGRAEYDQEATREMMDRMLSEGEGKPFGEEP